jgi:hypothetical protein
VVVVCGFLDWRPSQVAALGLQVQNQALWEGSILPHLADVVLADKIDASVQYGVHLYGVIVEAWRVMAQGALHQKVGDNVRSSHFDNLRSSHFETCARATPL